MFFPVFFLISLAINLSCAFAWFSVGVFGFGVFFIVTAAIALFGVFYSLFTISKESI